MLKILVLGAKGMLGKAVVQELNNSKRYQVIAWDKEDLDITDSRKVVKAIKDIKPNIIINTAAYTDVDGAESHKDLTIKINGEAVGILASASNKISAFFIHISTDYVFGQEKKKGYSENNVPQNPLNVYGKSKLLGEKLLLKEGKNGLRYYLIRTSWLFGKNGKNFIDTILNLAEKNDILRVVNDQHGKPTYAKDLAKTIKYILKSKMDSGVYHFTNEPCQTWYDFAKLIFKIKKEINPKFPPKADQPRADKIPKIVPVKTEQFPRPAKRPEYSVLLNTKLPQGRNLKEALREYLGKP